MSAGRKATTDHPISPLIAQRWSARAINPNQAVPRDVLLRMLEAARWAPSCFGDEPWRYMVWDRSRNPDAWQAALACLAEKNQQWARNAPVLLLSLASQQFSKNAKSNRWGQYDTGAATENLHLQGVEEGLVVHQMGGFDADQVMQTFAIPDSLTAMAMIAIGYPASVDTLPESFHSGETAARTRTPLAELVCEDQWDKRLAES